MRTWVADGAGFAVSVKPGARVLAAVDAGDLDDLLVVAGRIAGIGRWANLTATGPVPAAGWWAWLGPGMLATLLGAYTIVGFEASATLAEETHQPRHVVPRAMVQAVVVSGVLGMVFLVALARAIPHPDRITGDTTAPVAAILQGFLGGSIEDPAAMTSQPPLDQDTPLSPDTGPAGEQPLW